MFEYQSVHTIAGRHGAHILRGSRDWGFRMSLLPVVVYGDVWSAVDVMRWWVQEILGHVVQGSVLRLHIHPDLREKMFGEEQ